MVRVVFVCSFEQKRPVPVKRDRLDLRQSLGPEEQAEARQRRQSAYVHLLSPPSDGTDFGCPVCHPNAAKSHQTSADSRGVTHNQGTLPFFQCAKNVREAICHPLANLRQRLAARAFEIRILILP